MWDNTVGVDPPDKLLLEFLQQNFRQASKTPQKKTKTPKTSFS